MRQKEYIRNHTLNAERRQLIKRMLWNRKEQGDPQHGEWILDWLIEDLEADIYMAEKL